MISSGRIIREFSRGPYPDEASFNSRLALSGSRGIGGVFTEDAAGLELFDLEEDEEDEEDTLE